MGGDGTNIRLIYNEDEQSLVFPQIAKKTIVLYWTIKTLSIKNGCSERRVIVKGNVPPLRFNIGDTNRRRSQ